ncbi:hypothetical protein K501DRAFT_265793 [Backusella circina FSU 941]|nr:hypothetical protein K501DRAFT_265793 [Backusella circina FSU 941]
MKWLSSNNTNIDKEDPNYIYDILNRNTDSPISISYKEDSLPNPCSPLTVFAISNLANYRVYLFSSRRKPVYIHFDSFKTLVLLYHIDSFVPSNSEWFLMKVLHGEMGDRYNKYIKGKLEIDGSRVNSDFYTNRYKRKFDQTQDTGEQPASTSEPSTSVSGHGDDSNAELEETIDIEEDDTEDTEIANILNVFLCFLLKKCNRYLNLIETKNRPEKQNKRRKTVPQLLQYKSFKLLVQGEDGYSVQLYGQLKQARQNFCAFNDQWYPLKQRLRENSGLLYVLCKKENWQTIPSFPNTVSLSRDEINFANFDHTKKQLLISRSDPGVVSTAVVNTSNLSTLINSVNRYTSLLKQPDTVDTAKEDEATLAVSPKAIRWMNFSNRQERSKKHRFYLIDIEELQATTSFQKGIQANYILNIKHSSNLIESLISSYQTRLIKDGAFASPDMGILSNFQEF